MILQEVMEKYDGHSERLPEGQFEGGKEIDLAELTKVLDDWKRVWDQLNPQAFDHRRYHEQRQLRQALRQHAQTLEGMVFKIDIFEGYSQEFVREHLLRENPDQENLIKDIFHPETWWLLIARTKSTDGSDYLDFCHANTRKVVRLKVSADSPLINSYGLAGPATPRGKITIFSDNQKTPAG